MKEELWHKSFNPKSFLSRVNLDSLIDHNKIYNENAEVQSGTPCILCSSRQCLGILLNDKTFICKSCFSEVSTISYPLIYEEARRDYLRMRESRRIAFEEFTKHYEYSKSGNPSIACGFLSLALLVFHLAFLVVPILLFVTAIFVYFVQEKKRNAWMEQRDEWQREFPEPTPPILRHFHDPKAKLCDRDHKILKIFNNWPGYPPFWNYLREIVLSRDKNHCQVSGCPSRVDLHVHHKIPVASGGMHVPDNLITLCEFHHALEPDDGHERVWGKIKTVYFTIVRDHCRRNPTNEGYHEVKTHVRRLELVNASELNEIKKYHSLSCPMCGNETLVVTIVKKVNVRCASCGKEWNTHRALTEETGPWLAGITSINKNKGNWKPRQDMFLARTENVYSQLSSSHVKKHQTKKRATIKIVPMDKKPLCPICESPMKVVTPKRGDKWKKFWGCTKYQTAGCKGSRSTTRK